MTQIEITEAMIRIDADILARAFKISPQDLQHRMRAGTITSRSERGEDEDAGRIRLVFFSQDRRVRVTADKAGNVLACDAAQIGTPPRRESDPATARRARLDTLLDEALQESFPASDPVAISFDPPGDS